MAYLLGEQFKIDFTVVDSESAPVNADELPTAILRRNGTDTAEVMIVDNNGTGRYTVSGTIPTTWAARDDAALRIMSIVSTKNREVTVNMGKVDVKLYTPATVNDASATASQFVGSDGLSATDDMYNGAVLVFATGANTGLSRRVTDYVGATKTFSFGGTGDDVDRPFNSAPANGDNFILIGQIGTI